jgi:hypothetical protein
MALAGAAAHYDPRDRQLPHHLHLTTERRRIEISLFRKGSI